MQLSGKIAVITGAAGGMGQAIAAKLAHAGASLVLSDIKYSVLEAAAQKIIEDGFEVITVETDTTQRWQVETLVKKTLETFGKVDILINNADFRKHVEFLEMDEESWNSVLDVYLKGYFNCTQLIGSEMARQQSGSIISIAAPPMKSFPFAAVNYQTAMGAVCSFTKSVAPQLGVHGIRVNAVAPLLVDTHMTRETAKQQGMYLEDVQKFASALIPLGRMCTSEEVAETIFFLVSDAGKYISGQVIELTGGL